MLMSSESELTLFFLHPGAVGMCFVGSAPTISVLYHTSSCSITSGCAGSVMTNSTAF